MSATPGVPPGPSEPPPRGLTPPALLDRLLQLSPPARVEALEEMGEKARAMVALEIQQRRRGRTGETIQEQAAPDWAEHYRDLPVRFAQDVLGVYPWSRQREILRSVRDNRRTAVPACHDVGKSFVAAAAVAWWLSCHPPGEAFAVTTAPTGAQVRAILWREINRMHARGGLPGRTNQTEWHVPDGRGGTELAGFGRKPADYQVEAGFTGIHARRVLVVVDEAGGIPTDLWDAAEGLITNENARILAIGHPDDPTSKFAAACAPGSDWNVIRIPYDQSPNFTGELQDDVAAGRLSAEKARRISEMLLAEVWVEERRRDWGKDSTLWQSRVLARFPEDSEDRLIPLSWVQAAQARALEHAPDTGADKNVLGVDVARYGDEETVILHRRGPRLRIVKTFRKRDTMRTAGEVLVALRQTGADRAMVDETGVGGGVVDRLREQEAPVTGVTAGSAARDGKRFLNLRAEIHWRMRDWLDPEQNAAVLPDDNLLVKELSMIRWELTSKGKIKIEAKEEIEDRLGHSPNRADALTMTFAPSRVKRAQIRVSGVLGAGSPG